jgi:hypothetical protein
MRVENQQLKLFLLDSGLVSSNDILKAEEEAQKKEEAWERFWLIKGKYLKMN